MDSTQRSNFDSHDGCGSRDRLEIDHIKSLAAGGSNDISNLQTLCRSCNARKRDRLDLRFDRRFNL